jgi:uncharacterized OsmC-like protein
VAEPYAKVLDFEASVGADGRVAARGESLLLPQSWSPEHLVLVALVRCSLASLGHHAHHEGIEVTGSGEASGTMTKRDDDGRYAFVEIACRLDVELTPPPSDLEALLEKAERGCFIGASLAAKPTYVWNVA